MLTADEVDVSYKPELGFREQTPEELMAFVLALPNLTAQQKFLAERIPRLAETEQSEIAEYLKSESYRILRADHEKCQVIIALIFYLAELTNNPTHYAIGLLAKANYHGIGQFECQEAVKLYNEAAAIYQDVGLPAKQAQSQIGKIFALAKLGRNEEAFAAGEFARKILYEHEEWYHLANLIVNLAIVRRRLGYDAEALSLLEEARDYYLQLGNQGSAHLLGLEINRGLILRNLGRFEESIQAHKKAMALGQLGEVVGVAQAKQNLAATYLVLGKYNEALALQDEAREIYLSDKRYGHAMLLEIFTSHCLLQLRRFREVLTKSEKAYQQFSQMNIPFEIGEVLLNQASAYCGLEDFSQALTALEKAKTFFEKAGNPIALADTDLQAAAVLLRQNKAEKALQIAKACEQIFAEHDLPVGQARACLVAAQAAINGGQLAKAKDLIARALSIGHQHALPALTYQGHHLRGLLAVTQNQLEEGLTAYRHSIAELERLYGRMMIEFRADFVADKTQIYEDIVDLSLNLNRPELGLQYSERAKSRALQDLLALRINLSVEARSDSDIPLVNELHRLRAERDRLYRRWEADEETGQRGETDDLLSAQQHVEQKVHNIEKRITELWHKLLIRNADYARDASLWQVRTEPIQPYLDANTLLIEFFQVHGQLVAFLVSAESIHAVRLPDVMMRVQQLLQLFWLNLRAVPHSSHRLIASQAKNAQGILKKIYQQLLAPLAGEMQGFKRWIIVPHGSLHYLPFHALHDGHGYLLEQSEISYLPGASLLRYCQQTQTAEAKFWAIGNSYNGRLPYTIHEAETVASLWQGQTLVEEEATVAETSAIAQQSSILHIAAHGDFRADNPLFSGLALADGWLTTLDIFNLRLRTSLVTLSACQTGRSVIGGGDELLGLMRAFLGAGTASLVSTFWAVEDQSTAQLMQQFYEQLAAGATKGAALQEAQLSLLQTNKTDKDYRHPYFWAPFYLVGHAEHL
ncbi:MAG: hypothetical protein CL608_31515 [Anaerolineaceae bacterium]|nr:hypothetical protein [Anaerolineaceae bacterium]